MKKPIYIYYKLTNFFQNHRKFINSKSSSQLAGEDIDSSTASDSCKGAVRNHEFGQLTAAEADQNAIAYPCGLVAKFFFNDTYTLEQNSVPIPINEKGISIEGDQFKKYAQQDISGKYWKDPSDEHFIVWSRAAGLTNFKKLWGKIEGQDLSSGTYKLTIQNNFDVAPFSGSKTLILSTMGPFGGKNTFIQVTSFICMAIMLGFVAYFYYDKQKSLKKQ